MRVIIGLFGSHFGPFLGPLMIGVLKSVIFFFDRKSLFLTLIFLEWLFWVHRLKIYIIWGFWSLDFKNLPYEFPFLTLFLPILNFFERNQYTWDRHSEFKVQGQNSTVRLKSRSLRPKNRWFFTKKPLQMMGVKVKNHEKVKTHNFAPICLKFGL